LSGKQKVGSKNGRARRQAGIAREVDLKIKLVPIENSDQPVLANFTRLNGAPGMVFIDFGFLEPSALSALSRLAQSGGKIPESLNGKLVVRVALGFDALDGLYQQLGKAVASLEGPRLAAQQLDAKLESR
jgi:hypothetical protein